MEEVVVQLYPFIALNLAIVVPGLMSSKSSALSLQQGEPPAGGAFVSACS